MTDTPAPNLLARLKTAVFGQGDPKATIKTLSTNIKTAVTVVGAVLVALNEALPLAPTDWRSGVTTAIAIGTVLLRDLTDVAQKLDES